MTERIFSLGADPCLADHALEGTPVVPLALLAGELAALRPGGALADLAVESPAFLRRGRDLPARILERGGVFYIERMAGAMIASARPAPPPAWPAGGRGAAPLAGSDLGTSLYGPVFFHGPAFRAAWRDAAISGRALEATLEPADPRDGPFARYPWNGDFPVLLVDLAMQAAGLLELAEGRYYPLPERCALLAARAPGAGPWRVRATRRPDGALDALLADAEGREVVRAEGVRFGRLARALEPAAAAAADRLLLEGGIP